MRQEGNTMKTIGKNRGVLVLTFGVALFGLYGYAWAQGSGAKAASRTMGVNATDGYGRTPLHRAAIEGNEALAKLLVSKGADVNAKDKKDMTPLHWAARAGHKAVAERLIERRAELNATDKGKLTQLYWAAYAGSKDVAGLLIARGANINARDKRGITPIHRACGADRKATAGRLLLDPNDDATQVVPRNADYKGVAELLAAKGANLTKTDKHGLTPLHWAALTGRKKVGEFLLTKGVKPDVFAAAGLGKLEDLERLIKTKPALARATDRKGRTPLHFAAGRGDEAAAEILLANGANVNARDTRGMTPLVWAALAGDASMAEGLIAKGADVNAADSKGCSALVWANRIDHKTVAALLKRHGAK